MFRLNKNRGLKDYSIKGLIRFLIELIGTKTGLNTGVKVFINVYINIKNKQFIFVISK